MIKHSFPHPFHIKKAHQVADEAFAFYQRHFPNYQMTLVWESEQKANVQILIKGVSISGFIVLDPNMVHLQLEVPLMFRIFQKQALAKIDSEMKRWFQDPKHSAV